LHRILARWLEDPRLAAVRTPEGLAKLMEAERGDWQRFWSQVQALAKRTAPDAQAR